jgi:hypothetical protein
MVSPVHISYWSPAATLDLNYGRNVMTDKLLDGPFRGNVDFVQRRHPRWPHHGLLPFHGKRVGDLEIFGQYTRDVNAFDGPSCQSRADYRRL